MIKPFRLNDTMKNQLITSFMQKLETARFADGRITIVQDFVYKDNNIPKVKVVFSPMAYLKMNSLVDVFDCEVAWHGTVKREDDVFTIEDIFVYPQTVTAATVVTDQKAYDAWLRELDDDTFNSMHFQGHSHVNMGVTPSSVDLEHQKGVISQLGHDDFYIFLITNKRGDATIKVYDGSRNMMFDGDSVEVVTPESFLSEAKKVVKQQYSYGYTQSPSVGKTSGKTTSSDGKTYGSNWNKGKRKEIAKAPAANAAFSGTPNAKQTISTFEPELPPGIDPEDYDEWIFGAAN